jgi:hypothetical protein
MQLRGVPMLGGSAPEGGGEVKFTVVIDRMTRADRAYGGIQKDIRRRRRRPSSRWSGGSEHRGRDGLPGTTGRLVPRRCRDQPAVRWISLSEAITRHDIHA